MMDGKLCKKRKRRRSLVLVHVLAPGAKATN